MSRIKRAVKDNALYLVFLAVYAFFHIFIIPSNDDLYKMGLFSDFSGSLEYTLESVKQFPRYLTYFTVNILLCNRFTYLIWKIMNCVCMFSILKSITFLFDNKKENVSLVCLMVSLYPFCDMMSAGAISTTVGYIWIVASALIAFVIIKKAFAQSIKWWEYIVYVVMIAYASGQEQMCIILVPLYVVLFAMARKKNNRRVQCLSVTGMIETIISGYLLSRQLVMNSRGFEAVIFFPDFNSLSFWEKLEMTFSSTMDVVVFDYGLFLVMSLVVAYVMCKKYDSIFARCLAVFPVIITILGNISIPFLENVSNIINTDVGKTIKYGLIHTNNYMYPQGYISLAVLCLTGGIMLVNLYSVGSTLGRGLSFVGIILLGVISKMAIMFTPNVFASGYRVNIFLLFSLIIVTIGVVSDNIEVLNIEKNKQKTINAIIFVLAIIILLGNMNYALECMYQSIA